MPTHNAQRPGYRPTVAPDQKDRDLGSLGRRGGSRLNGHQRSREEVAFIRNKTYASGCAHCFIVNCNFNASARRMANAIIIRVGLACPIVGKMEAPAT